MKLGKVMAGLSVLTLAAAPVVAQAAQAEVARTAASVEDSEQLAGGAGLITLLGFVAALGAVVIIASDDDEESESP